MKRLKFDLCNESLDDEDGVIFIDPFNVFRVKKHSDNIVCLNLYDGKTFFVYGGYGYVVGQVTRGVGDSLDYGTGYVGFNGSGSDSVNKKFRKVLRE